MKKTINLIILYIIANFVLYILIFYSASIIEREQKNKVADTITSIIRENFLMAQYRSVVKDLEKIKTNNFSKIIIMNNKNEILVQANDFRDSVNLKIQKNLWSDSKKTHFKGSIQFYYDFTHLFWISFKALLGSIILTLPLFLIIVNILKKHQAQIIENEKIKIIAKHTRQLSHDIRSPLATLQHIAQVKDGIFNEDVTIFKKALERINYLTNIHLQESKNMNAQVATLADLKIIILELIEEKKLEMPDFEIDYSINNNLISCVPNEIKTILSNLFNNSYEALEGRDKKITIKTETFEKYCELIIEDKGVGIPENILNKLGQEEVTTKKNGNGLGLLHAVESLVKWNARLNVIKSDTNGTVIKITFPLIKKRYVLIDNDELTRLTWTARAKKNGIEFHAYASFKEFKVEYDSLPKDSEIFIDSDLGENELRGEEIAELLHEQRFNNISMATGFSNDNFTKLAFLKSVVSKAPPF